MLPGQAMKNSEFEYDRRTTDLFVDVLSSPIAMLRPQVLSNRYRSRRRARDRPDCCSARFFLPPSNVFHPPQIV
jgi:hypothetical protein